MGPAGSGKSSYCARLAEHMQALQRSVHIVNLDPAADEFKYEVRLRTPPRLATGSLTSPAERARAQVSIDVKELVSLEDVMEEMELGPNGGLIFCMEYLIDNVDWLHDELEQLGNDAYVIFDCPGQIELFSHVPVMRTLVNELQRMDFAVAGVYLLDSQFMVDPSKYMSVRATRVRPAAALAAPPRLRAARGDGPRQALVSVAWHNVRVRPFAPPPLFSGRQGVLTCLSCMAALELPHINVLTKLDLLASKGAVDRYLDPPIEELVAELSADSSFDARRAALTSAIGTVISDYGMVNFMGLDPTEEGSIDLILMAIDHAIQYHDDVEPREPRDDMDPRDEDEEEADDFEGLGSVHGE